ncbi:MAG TPA: hypothetical protein VL495_08130 [Edaphobacter sp.]|jgi:hypothetical protein|nr:hypothetical protein [Edaphobacter sp.]
MSTQHHLTHRQLCDLLLASPHDASPQIERLRQHLHSCGRCASELDSLQRTLGHFSTATTAWASHTLATRSWNSPALTSSPRSFFRRPAIWVSAAAALFLAAAVPFALHHHSAAHPSVASIPHTQLQSRQAIDQIGDEALLEEIDQTLSSPIPAPMQPLADPTAGRSNQIDSTPRKN